MVPSAARRCVGTATDPDQSGPSDRPAWSDISTRLQNLRNLLSSERHLGVDQQRAVEAFDREMDHQMAADRSAARERRRRELDTPLQDQDNGSASASDNAPPTASSVGMVRARRRAFRPSERLQRYQRERLDQSGRPAPTAPSAPASHLSPPSPTHSAGDRGDHGRSKRRKLDDGTYDDESRSLNYGYHGQVVPGHLRMEVVSCDGGDFSDPQVPISTCPQNVLHDDTSVYCTKTNQCNLLLKHVGGVPFALTKIVVKVPRVGFDSPLRAGLVFVAMDDDNLLESTSPYDGLWPSRKERPFQRRYDSYRPSQEYFNSTRSPLQGIDRSTYLRNPTHDDDSEADVAPVPGLSVSVGDVSDDDDAADGLLSPRPWHDDEYSLRSYVDRYRPVYVGNDRHDALGSTSSDSEGYEPEFSPDDRLSQDRFRLLRTVRARQDAQVDGANPGRTPLPPAEEAQDREEEDAHDNRSLRRGHPTRIGHRTFIPTYRVPEPAFSADEYHASRLTVERATSKYGVSDTGAAAAQSNALKPHARFVMNRCKSSTAIRFDPPVSGRYILIKLWAQCEHTNIDVQAILVHGYGGARFFPSIEMR